MRSASLGASGVVCSAIGPGCTGMSEFHGPGDDEVSVATLQRGIDPGETLFETADTHGRGHDESLLGRAIAGYRDKGVIATKLGIVRDPNGPSGSLYARDLDNAWVICPDTAIAADHARFGRNGPKVGRR